MKVKDVLRQLQDLVLADFDAGDLEFCNYIPYDCGCPAWISDNKIIVREGYYRGSDSRRKLVGITEDYGNDS